MTERQADQLAAERIAQERLAAASTPRYRPVPLNGDWAPTPGKVWQGVPDPLPFACEKV